MIASILLGLNWIFRKKVYMHKGWLYYHRILTVIFLALVVLHIINVGGVQLYEILTSPPESSHEQSSTANLDSTNSPTVIDDKESLDNLNKKLMGADYKDGVYEGEATGFRAGLK